MSANRFLNYKNVLAHASSTTSVAVPVTGVPTLVMLVEGGFSGLYLLGPYESDCDQLIGSFDNIHVTKVEHWGKPLLKVGTNNAEHFQQVLTLLCDIADLTQLDSRSFAESVEEATSRWRSLLAPSAALSGAAERGLLGELWLLDRILGIHGPIGLDAWQGPKRELHDFSMGSLSVEVKATLARERIHVISDLRQLEPSVGASLYVLSLQLQPDGSPSSGGLPNAVDAIRERLRPDANRVARFGDLLRQVGYDDQHRTRYSSRYKLRSKPSLVKVDHSFPALTSAGLERALGMEAIQRIIEVQYSISLEHLGVEDGSPMFLELFPWSPSNVLP